MILEIEHYKHDTCLIGKATNVLELKRQLMQTEILYDKELDNFTELFCRMFGWSITDADELPDCVYDRDTKFFYKPKNSHL